MAQTKFATAEAAGEHARRELVLAALDTEKGAITAPELAQQLGLHVTTVRFHLAKLVSAGKAVKTNRPPVGRGRPATQYTTVTQPAFATLYPLLLDQLGNTQEKREQLAAQAGRAWIRSCAPDSPSPDVPDPMTVAVEALHLLGFQVAGAVSAFGTHELRICSCPLRELALTHPEIARGVQRGVVEEALALASPTLASQYAVSAIPDPREGSCEVTVQLAPPRNGTTRRVAVQASRPES